MTSEYPAGLSRSDIEFILRNDADVVSFESVEGAKALWRISCSPEGLSPVEVLIDNGINDVYVQALARIDGDHVYEALSVLQPYAVVGLAIINDMLFMRSAFFIEHSTIHALTNSYRAVSFAYLKYQEVIAA